MTDIYCHIHTPINIEEDDKYFIPPILHNGILYVIREKKLHNILEKIGYLQSYIKFSREQGYKNTAKWLCKNGLLNDGFLEGTSQYWIDDVFYKPDSGYKAFKKNAKNCPVIPEGVLNKIFKGVILYNNVKKQKDCFNDYVEKELNVIENELSNINNEKSLKTRLNHFQNNIFDIFLNNFELKSEKSNNITTQEIDNLTFTCESLLTWNDLFVFKTASISNYKDFKFNLAESSYTECLRENSFVKIRTSLNSAYKDEQNIRYLLEEAIINSQVFTNDCFDFGTEQLKKIIGMEEKSRSFEGKRKIMQMEKSNSSSATLVQNSRTIIYQTEEHIVSRYNSLKNYANIYFANESEMTKIVSVLNMDRENLKRLNSIIWGKPGKIETELLKFSFKKGDLPYSSYGYASINF